MQRHFQADPNSNPVEITLDRQAVSFESPAEVRTFQRAGLLIRGVSKILGLPISVDFSDRLSQLRCRFNV